MQVPRHISKKDWHLLLSQTHTVDFVDNFFEEAFYKEQESKKKKKPILPTETKETPDTDVPNGMFAYKSVQAQLHGAPVVIDLDYDIPTGQQEKTYYQCMEIVSMNLRHRQPLHLHFTNLNSNTKFRELYKKGYFDQTFADYHEEDVKDCIHPNENIVYLSPDGRAMKTFTGKEIFVIGGDCTKGGRKLSYGRAQQLGVRCASIPFYKCFQ